MRWAEHIAYLERRNLYGILVEKKETTRYKDDIELMNWIDWLRFEASLGSLCTWI
jgi:hypothetical protein